MSKMQRNLDGVYFRIERDGRWQSVCYSDMTATERDEVKLKDRLFIRGTFSLNCAIMCHG